MPADRPVWLRHEASFGHDIPGHPERPLRLVALERAMSERDWLGWEVRAAPRATREQIEAVHPAPHYDAIEAVCARGGMIDMDTAAVPATWAAALHAAGGAAAMVDALMDGARCGFAALRPPGHHAEPGRAMGFCFFNNVAVAAAHALGAHAAGRVMVVDWDVHHGNGTNEIFRSRSDVLFVSIHEWPLYPGTGPASDAGSGEGEGHTVNLPVPAGSGDAVFASLAEHVVAPLALAYRPGLLLVSAGFDAHAADPLATCTVTEAGYAAMTGSLRRAADELGVPLGFVLEGGYAVEALASSVLALAPVAAAPAGAVDAPALDEHPLAADARRRLARWWPRLTSA